jgi:hypothetical protein
MTNAGTGVVVGTVVVLGGAVVGAGVSVVVGGGAVVGGRVVKKRRVVRAKGESTEREMSKKEHTLNVSKMTNPYSQYPLIFLSLLFVFLFIYNFHFLKGGLKMNMHEIEQRLAEILAAVNLKDIHMNELNDGGSRCKSTKMTGSQVILFGLGKNSRCWDSDPSISSRYYRMNLPRLRRFRATKRSFLYGGLPSLLALSRLVCSVTRQHTLAVIPWERVTTISPKTHKLLIFVGNDVEPNYMNFTFSTTRYAASIIRRNVRVAICRWPLAEVGDSETWLRKSK